MIYTEIHNQTIRASKTASTFYRDSIYTKCAIQSSLSPGKRSTTGTSIIV